MDFPLRANCLLKAGACILAAMLALGTASAVTPSGQITAHPEVVIIPPGASSGTTSISWTTVNCAAAQVTVSSPGGTEQLFGDATSFQNSQAPWIGLTTFTFRLYGDRTRTLLLDSVVVTGVPAPSGSITANPLSFNLASVDATFSTMLSWTTSGGSGAWVTRSTAGGGQTLIAQGVSSSGSMPKSSWPAWACPPRTNLVPRPSRLAKLRQRPADNESGRRDLLGTAA